MCDYSGYMCVYFISKGNIQTELMSNVFIKDTIPMVLGVVTSKCD